MADNLTAGNPRAHRVRVFYDGTSTIAEGMPVCYNYLTTQNWFGGSVSNEGVVTANETTAEGSHNEGKYIYVCNPTCVSTETDADGAVTDGGKIITGDGDDFDDLQVGMFVSVSSATDSTVDGNYKITAHNVAGDTITLEMTTAFTTAAAGADDIVVKMNNIDDLAGVVCKGGWVGRTGPRVVDIYVPNGAIVPVKTELAATVAGRTILCLLSATQTLGNPETDIDDYGRDTPGQLVSRPVAIAAETISSAGLVLAKFDPNIFLYQGGADSQELQVATGTVNLAVNKSLIDFKNTDGHSCAWLWRTRLSGTGSDALKGVYRFDVMLDADGPYGERVAALGVHLDVACSASQLRYSQNRIADFQMRTQSDPDMTDAVVAGLNIGLHLRKNASHHTLTDGPTILTYFRFNSSGELPTHLFYATGLTTIGAALQANSSTKSWSTDDITIPIRVGPATYYIYASLEAGAA